MLQEILLVLRSTDKPVSLDLISHELNLDKNALDGMLQYLLNKGKIIEVEYDQTNKVDQKKSRLACTGCHDNSSCHINFPLRRYFTLPDNQP